jgi:hypothetical protein
VAPVTRQALRAWAAGVAALLAAGTGVASLAAGGTAVSAPRAALAAAVLSVFTATLAVVVTDKAVRTPVRCLVWGGTVPVLVAVANAVSVSVEAGLARGVLTSLPWLVGLGVATFGSQLPGLRLPSWWPRRSR